MLNPFRIVFLLFAFTCILVSQSCNHAHEGNCGEDAASSKGGDESHNTGQNCMNCHNPGGEGEGCFKVAGSVYDSLFTHTLSNVTVKLYTGANGTGTLKAVVDGDKLGNFYSTEFLNFSGYLYPSVSGPSGETRYMLTPVTNGECNSCHGVTQNNIWAR